jgi:hypothetical protein
MLRGEGHMTRGCGIREGPTRPLSRDNAPAAVAARGVLQAIGLPAQQFRQLGDVRRHPTGLAVISGCSTRRLLIPL